MSASCEWEVVEGFHSDGEYQRLLSRIRDQIQSGLAKEVRVAKPYSGIEWDEHWFVCNATNETWRLVAPDPPFDGVFKRV